MSTRKRLLILNVAQFGYHLDTYYYCKWARSSFQITYHGFDAGRPKLDLEGVTVRYVPWHGSRRRRYLRFLRSCWAEVRGDYDVIFVKYFPGCSLLRLAPPRRRFVLDIRTGSIAPRRLTRWAQDLLLRGESLGFRHVTVISASLARKLGLARVHLLPLGADPVATAPKEFAALRLLYVGTFAGRRLEDTVEAFRRFYEDTDRAVPMTYDLIGDGPNGEPERLRAWVREQGLADVIALPGFIHQRDLGPYYEKCNIGVSYIPINPIYNCQPPTKTFEYLLAGLPVIATRTTENAAVITEHNGVLIEDTPEAFYGALRELAGRRRCYCSERVRREALRYSWETIVRSNLVPYLDALSAPGGDLA